MTTDREAAARRVLSWVQEAPAHTSLVVGEKSPNDTPITRAEVLMTLTTILADIDRMKRLEAALRTACVCLSNEAMYEFTREQMALYQEAFMDGEPHTWQEFQAFMLEAALKEVDHD